MPAGGIYGLATGLNNAYVLPSISFSNNNNESWQILCRFKPLNNGVIFSVQFGPLFDVIMNLSIEGKNLILSLNSPSERVSETLDLFEIGALNTEANSFIDAEINFSVSADHLTAKLNVIHELDIEKDEPEEIKPISLEAELDEGYRIILGSQLRTNMSIYGANTITRSPTFTAIWNELALFNIPSVEDEELDELSEEEEPAETEVTEIEEPVEIVESSEKTEVSTEPEESGEEKTIETKDPAEEEEQPEIEKSIEAEADEQSDSETEELLSEEDEPLEKEEQPVSDDNSDLL